MSLSATAALPDCPKKLLDTLNQEHLAHHSLKELSMWEEYMGRTKNAPGAFGIAEAALGKWASDPSHLKAVRAALKRSDLDATVRTGLQQLESFFAANVRPDWSGPARSVGSVFGRKSTDQMFKDLLKLEEGLNEARKNYKYTFQRKGSAPEEGTLIQMRLVINNDADEEARRTAQASLSGLERHVLENGLIPVIQQRNRIAKRMGFDDYYEWKVRTNEHMTKAELFKVLDSLESRTRDAAQASLDHLEGVHGDAIRRPWNFDYLTKGKLSEAREPYFPLHRTLQVVGEMYSAMGVDFRGARLTMDLVDRKTKYPNGYIRAPIPAHVGADGKLVSAVTNFSSNAVPGTIGAGYDTIVTAIHETGHHANFSGIDTPTVAASQEESPTSVAGAETYSMFFDSLVDDPMFLRHYAKNAEGQGMPWELVKEVLTEKHRLRAFRLRSIMVVPYMEKALYEMSDAELTPDNVLRVAREIEKKLLLIEGSGRPVLSVTHIHSAESSAYYHGYLLADLADYMARAFFMERDGYIVNNPKVGRDLAKVWLPGNSLSFPDMVRTLTGKEFSADAAVELVNLPMDQFLEIQRRSYDRAAQLPPHVGPIRLNGHFTVEHGDAQITTTLGGKTFEQVSAEFSTWIQSLEAEARERSKLAPTGT